MERFGSWNRKWCSDSIGAAHFIEPMITREWLVQKSNFVMDISRRQELGRATRHPTGFRVVFDDQAKAHHLVLSEFVPSGVSGPLGYRAPRPRPSIASANSPSDVSLSWDWQASAERVDKCEAEMAV